MANDNNLEQDRSEILRLHNQWMRANAGFDIDAMCGVFVGGDRFQGFNLNGHTYFQRAEWERLWSHLRGVMEILPVTGEKIIKLEIRGNAAWLAFESMILVRAVQGAAAKSSGIELPTDAVEIKFRGSEVFVREDENGKPVWKMWHCHFSPCAPAHEPRPGF
jgi:hypothetical protein